MQRPAPCTASRGAESLGSCIAQVGGRRRRLAGHRRVAGAHGLLDVPGLLRDGAAHAPAVEAKVLGVGAAALPRHLEPLPQFLAVPGPEDGEDEDAHAVEGVPHHGVDPEEEHHREPEAPEGPHRPHVVAPADGRATPGPEADVRPLVPLADAGAEVLEGVHARVALDRDGVGGLALAEVVLRQQVDESKVDQGGDRGDHLDQCFLLRLFVFVGGLRRDLLGGDETGDRPRETLRELREQEAAALLAGHRLQVRQCSVDLPDVRLVRDLRLGLLLRRSVLCHEL
mmetsp:Transcript_17761/g.50633  ORF Transcript_17761/g.50633 Transcript_17761/m.50633 type:complete len:284 (+) Transcript_17761:68-919(+)